MCDLQISCDWNTPPPNFDADAWQTLSELYDNPGDIDLFSGGLGELIPPGSDGVVGETFGCLIAKQFKDLKFGDRFFFTHTSDANIHVHGLSTSQVRFDVN